MTTIDIKYNIGDKLITNDEKIVVVKAVHIYISGMVTGYQLYVTDIGKTRKSRYISENDIYDFYESFSEE